MSPETVRENPTQDEVLRKRIAALRDEIETRPARPIHFESFYKGDALRVAATYGGFAVISEAYKRLRRFMADFENKSREGQTKVGQEMLERAEESLHILQESGGGGDISKLEKRAAEVITKDVMRRAEALKEALDQNTIAAIAVISSEIRELLNNGLVNNTAARHEEDKFPLAYVITRVQEIERFMERGIVHNHPQDEKDETNSFRQKQIQIREKKALRKKK